MAFSDRLKFLRLENNMDQKELAEILDLSKQSISAYEKGRGGPNSETLMKMADHFGVTTDYLLGRSLNSHGNTTSINSKQPDYQTGTAAKEIKNLINNFGLWEVIKQVAVELYKDEDSGQEMAILEKTKTALDKRNEKPISDDLGELLESARNLKPEQIVLLKQLVTSMLPDPDDTEKIPTEMPES